LKAESAELLFVITTTRHHERTNSFFCFVFSNFRAFVIDFF